jgi:cytochrome c6
LKKDVLEANGMNSVNAITYQVTNGKNAMPAFGGRLDDSDIEDVANYVLSQSEKGWD